MFSSFAVVEGGRYRERCGLDFEEFVPGQVFHHRPGITMTQEHNVDEALTTLNQAMVHYDEDYAGKTEFGQPLIVSTLTVQRGIGMAWKTFGRRRRIIGWREIRLTAPVLDGDTLYARSRVLESGPADDDCGRLAVETTLAKHSGEDVCVMVWEVEIFRRGCGPLARAGY